MATVLNEVQMKKLRLWLRSCRNNEARFTEQYIEQVESELASTKRCLFQMQEANKDLVGQLDDTKAEGRRWFHVSKKLPEKGQTVLAYHGDGQYTSGFDVTDYEFYSGFYGSRYAKSVKHWTPLEPPQAESEVENGKS